MLDGLASIFKSAPDFQSFPIITDHLPVKTRAMDETGTRAHARGGHSNHMLHAPYQAPGCRVAALGPGRERTHTKTQKKDACGRNRAVTPIQSGRKSAEGICAPAQCCDRGSTNVSKSKKGFVPNTFVRPRHPARRGRVALFQHTQLPECGREFRVRAIIRLSSKQK